MQPSRNIDKYLRRYAEPEVAWLDDRLSGARWTDVVVLPARDEDLSLLDAVRAPARGRDTRCLLIVVVNGERETPANLTLLERLGAIGETPSTTPRVHLHTADGFDVLVLDRARASRCFRPKQGVGLARKIGCDVALTLHRRGAIASRWIHMTDADARLPTTHFDDADALDARHVARVAPFQTTPGDDPATTDASYRYERWLRYYVLGLAWARSPYAHHSIGSLISITVAGYAAVRGVPKRQAGEDFYVLDKLRKLGPVARHATDLVDIRARRSLRVPFGTGPSVDRIVRGDGGPLYLDPRCFVELQRFLHVLDRVAHTGQPPDAARCGTRLWTALATLGFDGGLTTLCQRYPPPRLAHHVFTWFDGFRTMKLLHELRDAVWPARSWNEVQPRARFLCGLTGTTPDEQCASMRALERVT